MTFKLVTQAEIAPTVGYLVHRGAVFENYLPAIELDILGRILLRYSLSSAPGDGCYKCYPRDGGGPCNFYARWAVAHDAVIREEMR